jgi:hypothetical protein
MHRERLFQMIPNREELALSVVEAEWSCLRAHLKRGGLIVVAADLDLLNVAACIAGDDSSAVQKWISEGKLAKPSEAQILDWDTDPSKIFSMLITSPYVLMQELPGSIQ